MELPKEIIDKFKESNYATGSVGPNGIGRLCRTELVKVYDEGGHDQYPTSCLYNVLRFVDGEVKKADSPFAEMAGQEEAELIVMLIDWLQQNYDEYDYEVAGAA